MKRILCILVSAMLMAPFVFTANAHAIDHDTGNTDALIEYIRGKPKSDARIIASEDDFTRLRSEIQSGIKLDWFKQIRAYTKSYSVRTPIVYGRTDGIRMRSQSEQFANIVGLNAFMYRLTGDTSYADRAITEINALMAFEDWNPYHFLDTAQFMNGMAIGYNWLYDYLDTELKAEMVENIISKGLIPAQSVYDGVAVQGRVHVWHTSCDNWNLVCNGGVIMACLAICADTDDAIVSDTLTYALASMELGLSSFESSSWYEGPSYWQLSIETAVEAVTSIEASLDDDLGFLDNPGLGSTGYFIFDTMGAASFNFSDAGEKSRADLDVKELFYLSRKYNDANLGRLAYDNIKDYGSTLDYRVLIYCHGEPEGGGVVPSLDSYYQDSEAAMLRSSADDDTMLFAAIGGGANADEHAHLDIGSFVIDAFGDRFVSDLGNEDYNLSGKFFNKYRNRAEGHNTLVFNPVRFTGDNPFDSNTTYYDQASDAVGVVEEFKSGSGFSYAIVDMTSAYGADVTSAKRGLMMCDNKTKIILRDEIKSDKANEIYSFITTPAEITLSDNDTKASLSIGDNVMEVKLVTPTGAKFEIMPCAPIENGVTVAGQHSNTGYQKLAVHLTDTADTDITIIFTPQIYLNNENTDILPLDSWKTLSEPNIPTLPKLTGITVDGIAIEDFNPDINNYIITLGSDIAAFPDIEATGDGDINITKPSALPGDYIIEVTKGGLSNKYIISFKSYDDEDVIYNKADIDADKDISLIIAVYDTETNELLGINTSKAKFAGGTELVTELQFPRTDSDTYVKVFVWQGIKPVLVS